MSDLLSRSVLVIEQRKGKFFEMTDEYRIMDDAGNNIGAIRQEGLSKAQRLQALRNWMAVYDANGAKVLELRLQKAFIKFAVQVRDAHARDGGRIVRRNDSLSNVWKTHFALEAPNGDVLGSINANWRHTDFAIHDASGTNLGGIEKTKAGGYRLHISGDVRLDLRLLMIASPAVLNMALNLLPVPIA